MTAADLAGYSVKERDPVCTAYRGYGVCGMGPPSAGGLAVAQILKLIEPFELGKGPAAAMNGKALHLIAEAEKLAFADRDAYIGDPDFVPAPAGLLNAGYLDTRRALINPGAAMARPAAGAPPQTASSLYGEDATIEAAGTSHFSIVDGDGNVLAMTTSIEAAFGSRLWAAGFLLNNELTAFAFRPVAGTGPPLATAPAPGTRPRSSMAPTLGFDAPATPGAPLGAPAGLRAIP